MNCEECRELLSEYADGELDSANAAKVQEHLESCRPCRDELTIIRKIDSLAKKLPRHLPSTGAVLRMKASFRGGPQPQRRTEFGPVLNMEDLAEFLRVDKEIIAQQLDEIPCFEFGGKILFRRKSIEVWIERKEKDFGFQVLESELHEAMLSRSIPQGGRRWTI